MSLPPPKRPAILPTPSDKSIRSQHRSHHDERRVSSASIHKYVSSIPQVDGNNGRTSHEGASHTATGPVNSVFTPSSPPMVVSPLRKASSSSQLNVRARNNAFDINKYNGDVGIPYVVGPTSERSDSTSGLRTRIASTNTPKHRQKEKSICTGPGRGAGETETEPDEPPRHLPTSRKLPTPPPLAPPTPLARVTPLLFQTFRLLSVVPAFAGAGYHLFNIYRPQNKHSPLDHLVCLLWALLTAYQCLSLTTGLLVRWKAYYPPLPTLIRLLGLQAICWPATQFTLVLFNHDRRPVVCWAIIGSTTCVSRSIQLWVTSNLLAPSNLRLEGKGADTPGFKWGPRRWDWTEVGVKCALPMGVAYFMMAWAEALRRELSDC